MYIEYSRSTLYTAACLCEHESYSVIYLEKKKKAVVHMFDIQRGTFTQVTYLCTVFSISILFKYISKGK